MSKAEEPTDCRFEVEPTGASCFLPSLALGLSTETSYAAYTSNDGVALRRLDGQWKKTVWRGFSASVQATMSNGRVYLAHDVGGADRGEVGGRTHGRLNLAITTYDIATGSTEQMIFAEGTWTQCYAHVRRWAICVDAAGEPHVGWVAASRRVYYARRCKGEWSVENVAKKGDGSIAIAVDEAGRPHLLFDSSRLRFASRTERGYWRNEDVGQQGGQFSLAVDAQGIAHIAFLNQRSAKDRLWYGRRGEDGWETEPVDRDSKWHTGFSPTIAIDSADQAQIGYVVREQRLASSSHALAPAPLRLASRVSGRWQKEHVALCGWHATMALSANDEPLFAFTSAMDDQRASALMIARPRPQPVSESP